MAFAAKLMNPTPWDVKVDWDRGIKIRVPAFGDAQITMQQMDDYRGNKPGSEAVNETLNYDGLFLLDADRPYDNQALEALKRCYAARKMHYDGAVRRIREARATAGIPNDESAFEETLEQHGYVTLRKKVAVLQKQISQLESAVKPERSVREQLDPARTLFVTNPPRQFPSVAAMEFFLDQNPEIAAEHEADFQNKASATEEVAA